MYVTCVPQRKRNHDGWHEGVHTMMGGIFSGHHLSGNKSYDLLGCFEPSLALHPTNTKRADYSNSGRLYGYREQSLT